VNCKPADLAYIVRSNFPENIGKVIKIEGVCKSFGLGYWAYYVTKPTRGEVLGEIRLYPAGTLFTVRDANVRPISGVPVDDETPIEIDVSEAVKLTLGPDVKLPVRWPA